MSPGPRGQGAAAEPRGGRGSDRADEHARAEIRKDLWSYVLHNESQGLQYLRASPETESVVHSYTQAHPMALGETVDVMLLGGGDGPPDGGYY
jgi:hypothetical protein